MLGGWNGKDGPFDASSGYKVVKYDNSSISGLDGLRGAFVSCDAARSTAMTRTGVTCHDISNCRVLQGGRSMTTETGISGGVAAAPDRFEKNKIQRRVVVAVLTTMLLAVAWIVGNRWMPGGVPPGIVVLGVVLGGLNSLIAMGLILIYRAIRVINFAQAALGGLASAVAILLVTGSHLPVLSSYWAAVPLGIILAIATGFVSTCSSIGVSSGHLV